MKLCKDCRHFNRRETRSFDECLHPDLAGPPDVVRGEPNRAYCQLVRADERCGPDGTRWEPKQ